jgi:hypothetical protein
VFIYMRNARYGQGVDSTVRMRGDAELCKTIHGVDVNDCHFDSEAWASSEQHGEYEMLVMAGARHGQPLPAQGLGPVWQFRSGNLVGRCHDDRSHVPVSCDHFGNTVYRDDPQTPLVFEGRPEGLGYQRDEFGPYAGFFMIPHCTSGQECSVRACLPLAEGDNGSCAPWLTVDWRE